MSNYDGDIVEKNKYQMLELIFTLATSWTSYHFKARLLIICSHGLT